MRNIIYTSLICIGMAGQAMADLALSQGCFVRNYSEAHLAKNPKQVVDWIRMKILTDQYDQTIVDVDVLFANQGHAKQSGHGGQILTGVLFCWESEGRIGCSVDCDGGSFIVKKDTGKSLVVETVHLMIGETEMCGGSVSLAEETGKPTTYLLHRVEDAACEGN